MNQKGQEWRGIPNVVSWPEHLHNPHRPTLMALHEELVKSGEPVSKNLGYEGRRDVQNSREGCRVQRNMKKTSFSFFLSSISFSFFFPLPCFFIERIEVTYFISCREKKHLRQKVGNKAGRRYYEWIPHSEVKVEVRIQFLLHKGLHFIFSVK